jgi:hypothetical protein
MGNHLVDNMMGNTKPQYVVPVAPSVSAPMATAAIPQTAAATEWTWYPQYGAYYHAATKTWSFPQQSGSTQVAASVQQSLQATQQAVAYQPALAVQQGIASVQQSAQAVQQTVAYQPAQAAV